MDVLHVTIRITMAHLYFFAVVVTQTLKSETNVTWKYISLVRAKGALLGRQNTEPVNHTRDKSSH